MTAPFTPPPPIPFNLPNIGIPGSPGEDPQVARFLQFLLAGSQGAQRAQELELEKERLKQQRMEFSSKQSAHEQEQKLNAALGEGLRSILLQGQQQMVQAPEIPLPTGTIPSQPMMVETTLGTAVRQLPAGAVPAFVEQTKDIRADLIRQRNEKLADAAMTRALSTVRDPRHREVAQAMATFDRMGVDLPVEAQRAIWPDLFQANVDPAVMNSALRYGIAGGLDWGQIRSLFDLPRNEKIPDDFKFPLSLGGGSEKRDVAAMHYASLSRNGPIIDRLIEETGGISIPAQVYRTLQATQASSGGITGLLANLTATGVNWVLSTEQQQLVNAQFAFTNSYRYLVSGQQTSDREFIVILNTIAESSGDEPEVMAQKKAFRQVMTEAAGALARGGRPTDVANSVLTQARAMNLSPEAIAVLGQQAKDAQKFQASGVTAPPVMTRDPADAQAAESRRLILDMIMGTN